MATLTLDQLNSAYRKAVAAGDVRAAQQLRKFSGGEIVGASPEEATQSTRAYYAAKLSGQDDVAQRISQQLRAAGGQLQAMTPQERSRQTVQLQRQSAQDMGPGGQFVAGLTSNLNRAGIGLKQAIVNPVASLFTDDATDAARDARDQARVQQIADDSRGLLDTGFGKLGNVAGSAVQIAPWMVAPELAAPRIAAAAAATRVPRLAGVLGRMGVYGAAGAGEGAVAPTTEAGERATNAVVGGLLGGPGGEVLAGVGRGVRKGAGGAVNAILNRNVARKADQRVVEGINPTPEQLQAIQDVVSTPTVPLVPGVRQKVNEIALSPSGASLTRLVRNQGGEGAGVLTGMDNANTAAMTKRLEQMGMAKLTPARAIDRSEFVAAQKALNEPFQAFKDANITQLPAEQQFGPLATRLNNAFGNVNFSPEEQQVANNVLAAARGGADQTVSRDAAHASVVNGLNALATARQPQTQAMIEAGVQAPLAHPELAQLQGPVRDALNQRTVDPDLLMPLVANALSGPEGQGITRTALQNIQTGLLGRNALNPSGRASADSVFNALKSARQTAVNASPQPGTVRAADVVGLEKTLRPMRERMDSVWPGYLAANEAYARGAVPLNTARVVQPVLQDMADAGVDTLGAAKFTLPQAKKVARELRKLEQSGEVAGGAAATVEELHRLAQARGAGEASTGASGSDTARNIFDQLSQKAGDYGRYVGWGLGAGLGAGVGGLFGASDAGSTLGGPGAAIGIGGGLGLLVGNRNRAVNAEIAKRFAPDVFLEAMKREEARKAAAAAALTAARRNNGRVGLLFAGSATGD